MAEQTEGGGVERDDDGLTAMDRRERDLIEQIETLRREYMKKCEPLAKEIGDIRACRGPEPMLMPDGRLMTYIGPRPIWTPEGIKWPGEQSTAPAQENTTPATPSMSQPSSAHKRASTP